MLRKRSDDSTAFEYLGEWWDVRRPRQKWHGRLEGDDVDGARLVLNERQRQSRRNASDSYDVVLGLTNDGQRISLLNCFNVASSSNSAGLGRREIFANVVLRGIHVREANPLVYGASAVFRNGDLWWNRRSLKPKPLGRTLRRATIRYAAIEPVILFDDGETRLSIYSTLASLPGAPDDNGDYSLKEEVRFECLSKKRKPLSYFTDTLFACRDLLSIACQDYCDTRRLSVYQDRKYYRDATYHGVPVFKSDPKRRRRHDVLFRLSDIHRSRQKVFEAWLAEAKQLAAMCALYALAVHGNHFVEGRFLALCQGIEGFHFRYRKGVFLPPDAFHARVAQPLIAAIPKNIDPLLKASLEDRIKYGYQFSLNKRLKLLFAEFKDALDAVVPNAAKLIRPIVEQRNYLVHDPLVGGFQGRPDREEYLKFNFVLKMVTELCLLSVMKIPKKKITQLFAKSYLHKATAQHLFKTSS